MTLGQRIKHFRKAAKKSQKDIYAETDIPQTTLSGWENDICEPGATAIIKMAKAFGVSVIQLLYEENQRRKSKAG